MQAWIVGAVVTWLLGALVVGLALGRSIRVMHGIDDAVDQRAGEATSRPVRTRSSRSVRGPRIAVRRIAGNPVAGGAVVGVGGPGAQHSHARWPGVLSRRRLGRPS
ncbi:hypothetical protein [Trujillonella humicola]|uniref:hypothetical protein n=1 Tax=Trujillonella humicola TaxID=3383699 RepID=UPI003906AB17